MTRKTSRRRFLTAAAATGALAALNVTVLAQEEEYENPILLGGRVAGWQGFVLPGGAEATGTANPTLELQEGTTYTLLWQNMDGAPHNFAIQDSDGNNLTVLEPLDVDQETFTQLNETAGNETTAMGNQTTTMENATTTEGATTTVGNETTTDNVTGNQTGTGTPSLVAESETISEQGAVQAVRFTANADMAQYICLVHPNTMVGEVNVTSGGTTTTNSSG